MKVLTHHIRLIKIYLFSIIIFGFIKLSGQSPARGISIGKSMPHNNSILDISSTNKGVLFPRMTTSERQSITINSEDQPEGLFVYDTDKFAYYFYKNGKWEFLSDSVYSKVRELKMIGLDSLYLYQGSDSMGVHLTFLTGGTYQDSSTTNLSIRANNEGSVDGLERGEHSVDLQTSREDENQVAEGDYSVITGGSNNKITDTADYSVISGGDSNTVSAESSIVGGGKGNTSSGLFSTIGGGLNNKALGMGATVGGGEGNIARGQYSTMGGGLSNTAGGEYDVVFGGRNNQTTNTNGGLGGNSIGGGDSNQIIQQETYIPTNSTIGGGKSNTIVSQYAVISGGKDNMAAGHYSMVSGGQGNTAHSYGEWVGGLYADNYTPESITLFDSTDRLFVVGNGTDTLNRSNALTILKNGNVGIGVPAPSVALDIQGDIKLNGAIIHPSDRRLKKDITDLNNTLEIINLLSPKTYNWKDTNLNRKGKSVGLIAQDLEKILPNLVHTPLHSSININGEGITNIKTINYIGFIPYLLHSTQELDLKIKNLKVQIEAKQNNTQKLNIVAQQLKQTLKSEQESTNKLRIEFELEQQTIKDMASEIKKMKIQMNGIRQGIEALGVNSN